MTPYVPRMILYGKRVFLLRTHPMPLPRKGAINQNRKSNQPFSSAEVLESNKIIKS